MLAPVQPGAPGARQAGTSGVVECVVNVSEGCDPDVVSCLAESCRVALLDLHADRDHNRSVFTLAGRPEHVEHAVRQLAREAVRKLDLRRHAGVHPRFGVLDVVPWVALEGWPLKDAAEGSAIARAAGKARQRFASWVASQLGVPVFFYGPERPLPEVRRRAWKDLSPDLGPQAPHASAGSVAVGLRPLLVAYNLWMGAEVTPAEARAIAQGLRGPDLRALALQVRGGYQVSCNLLAPYRTGPAVVYDQVARLAPVQRAELVGLVPQGVLAGIPERRWPELGLSVAATIESRLLRGGWRGGSS